VKEPVWLLRETVLALQEELLAQFGGSAGVREEHLPGSALARPQHLLAQGKPSHFDMAASYACGLVRNHAFVDGNKRIGFTVAVVFLELNGHRFQATEADAVVQTLALAAGDLTEAVYAEWLEKNSTRRRN